MVKPGKAARGARMPPKKKEEEVDRLARIAIVNKDKCKPKKCRQVRYIQLGWRCCVFGTREVHVEV